MKQLLFIACLFLTSISTFAQNSTVKGHVADAQNGEELIGATIVFNDQLKAKSDIDGNYVIENVPFGKYTVTVSMATYQTQTFNITIKEENQEVDFLIGEVAMLEEVKVVANVVQERKTPVAVSTLDKRAIDEELGSQDLPMVLNSKPGVHATQTGGGDGDARITIRGFDQRNVGMMIDGVPVNDMENGWVYWSNWFGLDAITQQIQVQRGLGATKLAMPSVGGTMNIITDNAFGKQQVKIQQEYGSGDFFRTSVSYRSGLLKGGWGIVVNASYKQGNGWVDGLSTQGGFYYAKIQKKFDKHVLSLSAFGAPQQHAQRSYNQPITYWSKEYAEKLGIDATNALDRGRRFNEHTGYYTDENGKQKRMAERRNYYHKPQITLRDYWKINENLSWTNTAYVSIGRGGGERAINSSSIFYNSEGTIDWDKMMSNNQQITIGGMTFPSIDEHYSETELRSSQALASLVNNHMWVGGVSQVDYKINNALKFAGGIDYRWYKGTHYAELTNLLGGDYYVNGQDQNAASNMKRVGDKIGWQPYHNDRDALMQWIGGFAQLELEKNRWTAFINLSVVSNSYKGIDRFQKKELHTDNQVFYIGAQDEPLVYNGVTYTHDSKELVYNTTDTKWLTGFTAKGGANFNITEKQNVFLNVGYLDRTPMFSNVIDNNTNKFFAEILNEKIYAFEVGYGFRTKKVAVNLNGYYTMWKNKPFPNGVNVQDPNDPGSYIRANVNGMDALHMGVELDVAYYITKTLSLEGMASLGDFTWQSSEIVNVVGTEFEFDAKGVHVGDAAQNIFAGSVRWEFVKRGYIKAKYTYFDKYYSDFNPFYLTGDDARRDSWRIPSYGLLSLHAGYSLKLNKSALHFKANVFNVLNTLYISDAMNNQNGGGFDAASAGVYFGMGTTFNVSIGFEF